MCINMQVDNKERKMQAWGDMYPWSRYGEHPKCSLGENEGAKKIVQCARSAIEGASTRSIREDSKEAASAQGTVTEECGMQAQRIDIIFHFGLFEATATDRCLPSGSSYILIILVSECFIIFIT